MIEKKSREIRVLIADDHPIFREGLAKVISRDPRMQVVAEAENGDEALAHLTELRPDVAVLDLDMPERDGFAVTRGAQEAKLSVKVIILTSHNNEALFQSALDLGVAGYVLKDGAINEIVSAIRAVAAGRHYFSPELSTYLLNRANRPASFAERQPAVSELTASEALGVSLRTFEQRSDPRISHYRILRKLGEGGMGDVYLAEDDRLDRKVAVKLLNDEFNRNEELLQRFIREAKAASALNHPNILTVHDFGQTESGSHFIATEYIEGETLRHHIRHSHMNLRQVMDVIVQVASALSTAHQAGIIHRDIKPENVMVRPDSIVKVLDFGLAKLGENSAASTLALKDTTPGTILGTVQYMSPEQARGQEVDARTDIFSLGIVLYEIVAGGPPFGAKSGPDVLAAILEKEPPPLARFNDEAPAELQRIVSKCLRKEPDDRYQTMKGLLADLKELRDELALEAKLERSSRSANISVSENQPTRIVKSEGSKNQGAQATSTATGKTISSSEYLISEIKNHKRGIAVMLLIVLLAALLGYWIFWNR
jgi:serine/threonine protein kinase/DNA-binding NarL/FixJ family response regulator